MNVSDPTNTSAKASANATTSSMCGLPEIGNSGKAVWWLTWIGSVLLIRAFMVERKLDGARFGIIGCVTGALGALGDGDDCEWAALYLALQPSDRSTVPTTVTGAEDGSGGRSGHESGLVVGGARIGMWQLWLRKKLWIRWVVDLFSWHRMYWFGPPTGDLERKPQQSRRRLGTARYRYGEDHTINAGPANIDDLILVYGTRSIRVEEGSGHLDDFSRDRRWKAQRYGFYFLLFGIGLCIRSVRVGIIMTAVLEIMLCCSWFSGRVLNPDHQDFCNRVSRSAERIEQVARELMPEGKGEGGGGQRTLDVVLCYKDTAAWCRCAPTEHPSDPEKIWDNNTWISLCIPKSQTLADTVFAGLGLLAHTLLPWGWVRLTPNLLFASFAAFAEGMHSGLGLLVVLVLAPAPRWAEYPGGIWLHEDNWTLAWYFCLTQWISGHALDVTSIVNWVEQVRSSLSQ